MPLPLSGPISFNNINVELGVSGTTQASLGQASYRTLAGVPSGQISMSNFYGKANQFNFTISSPTNNANLASLAFAAGWPGASKLVATVAPGVVLSSDSTGVSALTISGSFPGGVELINNGTIAGRGGDGGRGAGPNFGAGIPGSPGGNALTVSTAVSINNLGTIAGGGGGGGGGAGYSNPRVGSGAGGGGGGGRSSLTNSSGGAAGSPQASSGASGTFSSAGGGGAAGGLSGGGGPGGPGGGWGSSGAGGNPAPRGNTRAPGGGGGGGPAVSGNPNITWINTGTLLGGIS